MLDFERALAGAEADAGVIPTEAAEVIATACADLSPAPEALAREGKRSGSLAVPLVKALTEHVAREDARAAAFVHYGSTSQDVLDTALVLCLKPCLADADRVLAASVSRLAGHARRHAGVVMLGRTLMQPATPITAGLKIARWAAALHRCRLRLGAARERALCVQLGGAVGTLDALGGQRAAVRRGVAERLGLGDARAWHDHRDELLRLMAELAIVTTTVGKIARDVSLLSQAEVGEMLESPPVKGVGGSSAMPHKRNPVSCLQALAAAARAPGLVATLLVRRRRRARARPRRLAGRADDHSRAGGRRRQRARCPRADLRRSRGECRADEGQHRLLAGSRVLRAPGRVVARDTDRASALALVDDWSTVAVAEGRHLRDVALAARPVPGRTARRRVLARGDRPRPAPVLDETLAGIPADA